MFCHTLLSMALSIVVVGWIHWTGQFIDCDGNHTHTEHPYKVFILHHQRGLWELGCAIQVRAWDADQVKLQWLHAWTRHFATRSKGLIETLRVVFIHTQLISIHQPILSGWHQTLAAGCQTIRFASLWRSTSQRCRHIPEYPIDSHVVPASFQSFIW